MSKRVTLIAQGQRVIFIPHAIDRYVERASRYDSHTAATDELAILLDRHGLLTPDAPRWIYEPDRPRSTVMWLCLGDDIAFPCERSMQGTLAAMTCMCRNGFTLRPERRRRVRRANGQLARMQRRRRRDQLVPTIELEEEAA